MNWQKITGDVIQSNITTTVLLDGTITTSDWKQIGLRRRSSKKNAIIQKKLTSNEKNMSLLYSGEKLINCIDTSQRIRDCFGSIHVALNLLGEGDRVDGVAHITRAYPINPSSYHWTKDREEISYGLYSIEIRLPAFIWRMKTKKNKILFFIIECDIDHKVAFPIRKVVMAYNTRVHSENFIHNEEEWEKELDSALNLI